MALGKYKLALRDYERVSKVRPNDKDAKAKFTECRKIVQQIAFNKAIAVEEKSGVAESIADEVEAMVVEDKYEGPHLENGKVTKDFVHQLLEHYRNQKLLHKKYAFQILLDARSYFMEQPTLVNVTVSTSSKLLILRKNSTHFNTLKFIFRRKSWQNLVKLQGRTMIYIVFRSSFF